MKMRFLVGLAGLVAATPAAQAAVITINYAPKDLANSNGLTSGTLIFDPEDAEFRESGNTPYSTYVRYGSPKFQHTYNIFGEQYIDEFGIDVQDFTGYNFSSILFYSRIPEAPLYLDLEVQYGMSMFSLPSSGYENGSGRTYFLNLNATSIFDLFIGSSEASYSVSYASAVPETATWAMMIAGFGILGGAMRRSRTSRSLAISA